MEAYPPEVEQQMQQFYRRLNERDRRAYAAVEVAKERARNNFPK